MNFQELKKIATENCPGITNSGIHNLAGIWEAVQNGLSTDKALSDLLSQPDQEEHQKTFETVRDCYKRIQHLLPPQP